MLQAHHLLESLIGGLAAIGLLLGRDKVGEEADMKMWMYSREFLKRFEKEIAEGSILCRDIVQVNWADPTQVKEYRQGEKFSKCKTLTGKTPDSSGNSWNVRRLDFSVCSDRTTPLLRLVVFESFG